MNSLYQLAEWQQNELQNEEDFVVMVAMTESNDMVEPTADDLNTWETELGLDCTMLGDPGWAVMEAYIEANPDVTINNAVTVILDRSMTIRHVRGEADPNVSLEELQALLAED